MANQQPLAGALPCLSLRRRPAERGTASMEALFCLPFVFLVFALIVNLGYGWLVRLKAEAGIRLGASYYTTLATAEGRTGDAEAQARQMVQQAYFPEASPIAFDARVGTEDLASRMGERGSGLAEALSPLRRLGAKLSGRTRFDLEVPRRVPTRTLLPDTPVRVSYHLDGGTWTHAEVPLTIDTLTEAGTWNSLPAGLDFVIGAVAWVGDKLFELLGMEP